MDPSKIIIRPVVGTIIRPVIVIYVVARGRSESELEGADDVAPPEGG